MAKRQPSPALLVLRPPGDLRDGRRGLSDDCAGPIGRVMVALRLVFGHWGGVGRRVDAKGTGGVSASEHRGHAQVGGQAPDPGVSKGALLRHLGSQVGPDARRVGVD